MSELAALIAKREGKKTKARIGEVKEILTILSDIIWETAGDATGEKCAQLTLFASGSRRAHQKSADNAEVIG